MNKNKNYPYLSPVPNNPRDDELYVDKKERTREKKFNKDNVIFGSTEEAKERIMKRLQEIYGLRKTATGIRVPRDEPTEPQKTQHLKVDKKQFAKDLEFWKKRNQQSAARERLKKKGAVPTKSGKKLFDDFCREAAYKNRKNNIDNANTRNIYNSAQHLSYEQWIWFVNNEYGSKLCYNLSQHRYGL